MLCCIHAALKAELRDDEHRQEVCRLQKNAKPSNRAVCLENNVGEDLAE